MGRVEGKVILITGAAQGIGAATAQLLAGEGATVIVSDLNPKAGLAVVEGIRSAGGKAEFQAMDVSQEADWQQVMGWIEPRYGGLDGLVNNAGIALVKPLQDTTLAEFRRVMQVNVEGVFLGMKYALPLLLARAEASPAGGAIVNLSSVIGIKGIAHSIAYGPSKAAVRHLSKCAALEFAEAGYRIRVNSVHPAITDTPMVADELQDWTREGSFGTHTLEDTKKAVGARLPMGRMALPVEVAQMILFLLSDESSFSTAGEFAVDGGRLAV